MTDTLLPFDGGASEPVNPFAGVVASVTLTVNSVALEVGTTATATVLVVDGVADLLAGRTVTWSSTTDAVIADPSSSVTGADGKASVSLPALAAGTTTITASCEGVDSSGIAISVSEVASPPGYSASGSTKVVVVCTSVIKRMGRPRPRRFSDAEQRRIDPTDTALSRVVDQQERAIVWPSKELLRRYL